MRKEKNKIIGLALVLLATLVAAGWYGLTHGLAVLESHGSVGKQEKHLIIIATLLMLIVVVPVYFLTFYIAWKYRASNKAARYQPEFDGNRKLEFTWWAIPGAIIIILSVVAWNSAHSLDPSRQLAGGGQAMEIQVVALPWKWLFIYPDKNIASVNFVELPVGRQVDFNITSDAPMNSFWIPQLGGQIYAMAGMSTHLHLMADTPGDYRGVSANISGRGFAGMNFTARAVSRADFDKWIASAGAATKQLDQSAYDRLAQPSENNPVALYSSVQPGLYSKLLLKYSLPNSALIGADPALLEQGVHAHD